MIAPIDVKLNDQEIAKAEQVARRRAAESTHLADKHGFTGDGLAIDMVGAPAEAAGCKALGLHWSGHVNHFKLPDARHNIQFRGTELERGSLIVRPDDDDRDYFALVTGHTPNFRLMGWMLGRDAKQYKWLRYPWGRPAAWFVPQRYLHTDFSVLLAT
jgi:hypothetical protein